jgi:hypothetical protein
MIARLLLAFAAAIALTTASVGAYAQARPTHPARQALATLDARADALFAAVAKRDWTGAQVALDATKGAVNALRGQAFESAYADAGGTMEAVYAARHRLDTAVAEADIAIGASDGPGALRSANRITEVAWGLASPITPPLTRDAQQLAFLARRLDYTGIAGQRVQFTETIGDVRQLWSGLRPKLAGRAPAQDLKAIDLDIARLSTGRRQDPEAARRLAASARALAATLG